MCIYVRAAYVCTFGSACDHVFPAIVNLAQTAHLLLTSFPEELCRPVERAPETGGGKGADPMRKAALGGWGLVLGTPSAP